MTTSDGQTVVVALTETTPGVFTGSQTVTALPATTTLGASYTDPDDSSDVANDSAVVPSGASGTPAIAVNKSRVSAAETVAGETVKYQIVVSPLPLSDNYSTSFDFVSATVAPDGSGGGTLFFGDILSGGTLAPNGEISISTTFTVKGAADPAGNTAAINFAKDNLGNDVPKASASDSVVTLAGSIGDLIWLDADGDGVKDSEEDGIAGVLVWLDLDNDGVRDANEPFDTTDTPVPNVVVELWYDPDGDGDPTTGGATLVKTTVTDNNGDYSFTNLGGGTYVVVEQDPLGATSVTDKDGDLTDPEFNQIPVLLGEGINNTGNDFLASVSGAVYVDTGDDDTLDGSGEFPIPGVSVELWADTNGDGSADVLLGRATTDGNGDYSFPGLAPGAYAVVSGDHIGHRFEVDEASTLSGDGNTLHLSISGAEATHNTATLASLSDLASDTIVLREHRLLEDAFPISACRRITRLAPCAVRHRAPDVHASH